MYEVIVVGGGPAGLTAAIHLAWHDRKALVIDRRSGPLFYTLEKLRNVPGMPETRGVDIQRALRRQAENLGAEVVKANVVSAKSENDRFLLVGDKGEIWEARTLLLATGVARYHPTVDGDFRPCFHYAGKGNLYYCPDCEAPEIKEKDTIVIAAGPADWGAAMAVGLSRYSQHQRLLLTAGSDLSDQWRKRLESKGIPVLSGKIKTLEGAKGILEGLTLTSGERLRAEAFFVSSPARGRTDLARQLGVEIAQTGYHAQPKSQRGDTNVPGVWVAGDLRPMTQQVSVAMGTGNIAAVMIDQYLRKKDVS